MVEQIGPCDDEIQKQSPSSGYGAGRNHQRRFRCGTSLRAIFSLLLPGCRGMPWRNCSSSSSSSSSLAHSSNSNSIAGSLSSAASSASSVTGTIFGQRKGRVSFCVQEDPCGPPLLLLEFAMPTHLLVKEMQSGLLRLSLECTKRRRKKEQTGSEEAASPPHLFAEPVWSVYCNGRKVGFAINRSVKKLAERPDSTIASLMSLMQSVSTGAGVIPAAKLCSGSGNGGGGRLSADHRRAAAEEGGMEDELVYMRAKFERVVGSADSEAFHMVSPDGSMAASQELSIFLARS